MSLVAREDVTETSGAEVQGIVEDETGVPWHAEDISHP
jgi:hypothetical protein